MGHPTGHGEHRSHYKEQPCPTRCHPEKDAASSQLPGEIAIQTATKPKRRPTPPQLNTSSTERISWSYIKNPKKTVETLTGKKEVRCEIPLNALHDYFSATATIPRIDVDAVRDICDILPSLTMPPSLMVLFDRTEVLETLKNMPKGSTPGSDGLSYDDWLNVDVDATLLTWIFNECLIHRKIPQKWKQSKIRK